MRRSMGNQGFGEEERTIAKHVAFPLTKYRNKNLRKKTKMFLLNNKIKQTFEFSIKISITINQACSIPVKSTDKT